VSLQAAQAPLEAGPQALLEVDVGKSGIPAAQQQLCDYVEPSFGLCCLQLA